ncbi:MAG: hypothetical protein AAF602_18000 [Myxococcota bacterium]
MLFVLASVAWGSPGYPTEIQSLSGGQCTPACTICHETNAGGTGTITQSFGIAMTERGLTGASNNEALAAAYTALIDDAVDSDGDGTLDADALADGVDPNTGSELCDVLTPRFGCLSHSPALPGLGLLGVLLVARRRRR